MGRRVCELGKWNSCRSQGNSIGLLQSHCPWIVASRENKERRWTLTDKFKFSLKVKLCQGLSSTSFGFKFASSVHFVSPCSQGLIRKWHLRFVKVIHSPGQVQAGSDCQSDWRELGVLLSVTFTGQSQGCRKPGTSDEAKNVLEHQGCLPHPIFPRLAQRSEVPKESFQGP